MLRAKQFGFTHIEAHNTFSTRMLDELIKTDIAISSIHSPCPALLTRDGIPTSNLFLSSTDENERLEAVCATRKTADLASEVGAKVVILHMGNVEVDISLEEQLHSLYEKGLAGNEKFNSLRDTLISERARKAPRHVEAAIKSIEGISRYAIQKGIMLGLENRVHYYELPGIDDMEQLLGVADEDILGYWHDTGHAQIQQLLGFTTHEEWLQRFSRRIVGVHLHDVVGISDHFVPGTGNVDWKMVARYLPKEAIKTCEVHHGNSEESLQGLIPFLKNLGIV